MRVGSQVKSSAVETDKIRVLIADDHVTVLEGLAAIIGRQHRELAGHRCGRRDR
jgi:hypothetical protein